MHVNLVSNRCSICLCKKTRHKRHVGAGVAAAGLETRARVRRVVLKGLVNSFVVQHGPAGPPAGSRTVQFGGSKAPLCKLEDLTFSIFNLCMPSPICGQVLYLYL